MSLEKIQKLQEFIDSRLFGGEEAIPIGDVFEKQKVSPVFILCPARSFFIAPLKLSMNRI